jgi:hypothetical protein
MSLRFYSIPVTNYDLPSSANVVHSFPLSTFCRSRCRYIRYLYSPKVLIIKSRLMILLIELTQFYLSFWTAH